MTKDQLNPDHVPNHKVALKMAEHRGCVVATVPHTGEVRILAPDGTVVVSNNRRKDASRALVSLIRRLQSPATGTTNAPAAEPTAGYTRPRIVNRR